MRYFHRFKDRSINRKNVFIFSILMIATLGSSILVMYFSSQQNYDSALVDIAGKNRMLSQRIGAMAQLIGCADENMSSIAKEELSKAILQHENALKVLKDGGLAPERTDGMVLPAASPIIQTKITEIQAFFEKHKELCNTLLTQPKYIDIKSNDSIPVMSLEANKAFQQSLAELQNRLLSGTLLKHNVELTKMFVANAEAKKNVFFVLLGFFLFLNISAILAIYYLTNKFISKPIRQIADVSGKMARGEVNTRVEYNSKDEIGSIATSINTLAGNLKQSREFIDEIGKGNFDASLDIILDDNANNDEHIGVALHSMRDKLKELSEAEEKRNWAAKGLARFAEVIRDNNDDIAVLGDRILVEIVKYLNVNQGSIFVVNEDNPDDIYLETLACYAYNKKKYLNTRIDIGEGLVGQIYLENEAMMLLEVPQNYVSIRSGLGEAAPSCLVLVPLKSNEETLGVLELAGFKPLEEYQLTFLKSLADNIASTLKSAKVNSRTKSLLNNSQSQAEQLRAAEEEMRQNMEEISATQEAQLRQQEELLAREHVLQQQLSEVLADNAKL
ncbi:MAG: HAMP domain-containing protein, partial [Cytophagales bacterium]